MPERDFQVSKFRTYEAKVEGISLGFINTGTGGYSPKLNETLQYDGITVILKDGREFTDVPQLRTAINSGWFVQVGDQVTTYRPKAAGIQVRPTETRGNERPNRMEVVTEVIEDVTVGSISARKAAREAVNAEATRKVPFQSQEARVAMEVHQAATATGDDELDEVLFAIDGEMEEWLEDQQPEEEYEEEYEEEEDPEAEVKAQAEADILTLLASLDDNAPAAPKKKRAKKVSTKSARRLPVDMQDERKTLPLVREDPTENAGTVVGNVTQQRRTVVERAQELPLNVAKATPEATSPKPKPRFGGTGVIVVDNEQRDMGRIALSSNAAPIRLDETAKVASTGTESIKMGEGAQVGTRKTASMATGVDGGVAVGRVLSPTTQSFVADDQNTSSTAIQRAQEGKQLKVEKFAVEQDEQVQGTIVGQATMVATGDVQETQVGENLTDILPDAATSPEPARKPEVHRRPEEDPAYMAVKMLIPEFEWNKDRQVKERVASAMKHIENPQYIKGILAVETEHAREEIKKALAAELGKRKKAKKPKKKAK